METKKCVLSQEDMIFNLNKSLEEEERVLVLYNELIMNLSDEEDKRKISHIIKEEEKHIAMLKDLIEVTKMHYQNK